MKTLTDYILELGNEINKLRAFKHFLETEKFFDFFERYTNKEELYSLIINKNKKALEELFKKDSLEAYTIMSVRNLRILARRRRIPYWSTMTKSTLLSELIQYDQRNRKAPSQYERVNT